MLLIVLEKCMSSESNSAPRARAIDALRGYAILTMVLSATIAGGILPKWMYHIQEPPPLHQYIPLLSGLTWVDLVFPFFLFAMGAALPFSVGKRRLRGESTARLVGDAVIRCLELGFFAIFVQHFYPYCLSVPQDPRAWLLAIGCFALLFPMYMRLPFKHLPAIGHRLVKFGAYAVAIVLLLTTHYASGGFDVRHSNIIILILANMALFGTLAYLLTVSNRPARIVIGCFALAFGLAADVGGSWAQEVARWSPIPFLIRFDYLRYLVLIIAGSIAGEQVAQFLAARSTNAQDHFSHRMALLLAMVCLGLVVANLWGLFAHQLAVLLVLDVVLIGLGIRLLRSEKGCYATLWRKLLLFGALLLFLSLACEPLQGGIRKDPATTGYLLMTSALAFFALLFFSILCDAFDNRRSTAFLTMSGQNPMVAYVAADLLIIPVLQLAGLFTPLVAVCHTSPWLGFLQGVVLTSLVLLVTMFFTRIRWFWRT